MGFSLGSPCWNSTSRWLQFGQPNNPGLFLCDPAFVGNITSVENLFGHKACHKSRKLNKTRYVYADVWSTF